MDSWYVVLTKPKQELRAKQQLEQQGGEVFLPMFQNERIKDGKRTLKSEPLFPGYLFLQLADNHTLFSKIRSTLGVRQFLCFTNQPVTVNNLLIADLKARTQTDDNVPLFKVGQKVALKEGPFKHYEAIFKEYQGTERAIVLLNLLGQQNEFLIELAELQKA